MTDSPRFDVGALPFGSAQAASARYRVLQFLPFLDAAGIRTTILSPAEGDTADCRIVWIQKKLLSLRKVHALARDHRLVFDFDDAVWTSEKGPRSLFARLRTAARLNYVLRKSALVLAGNEYLATYARRHTPHVRVVPTVLDTDGYPEKLHRPAEVLTLGWIGHSVNFRYLAALGPVLLRVAADHPMRLLVVADRDFHLEGLAVENRRWSQGSEVDDIQAMDIGLMPLADDEWTRGKCGFKAIQYMAAGVPAVASSVGMNRELIDDGVDGFLASTDAEWLAALRRLRDASLRADIGRRARAKIRASYSLASWGPIVSTTFKDMLQPAQ